MKSEDKEHEQKKPYEKPVLLPIELAAEEVLAIGCKLVSAGTNFGGSPCAAFPCASLGS